MGRRNKDFKKEGEAGSRGGCLKKWGAGTPLQTISIIKGKKGRKKTKNVGSEDKTLVGTEESAEAVIQNSSVNKFLGKKG